MDAAGHRRALYEAFSGTGGAFDAKIEQALDVGIAYLEVPLGFLTRIQNGTQEIVAVVGDHDRIRPGERCPLDEAYCRRTVEKESALAVQDAAAATEIADVAYDTFELGTYLGVQVIVDGETYGTVCFADSDVRTVQFAAAEEAFVELLATLVGQELEAREYRRELQERNANLERERERFRGIAETSADILFRLDDTGTFTYVSSVVESILGYEPTTLEGSSFTEFVAEPSVEAALTEFEELLEGETVEQLEVLFSSSSGEAIPIEVNATPLRGDDGTIEGVQGVGRDVSERRERQAELRLKNRAIDEANLGISIADPQQPEVPFVYVNDGFERITGYDESFAIGRNWGLLTGEATDLDTIAAISDDVAANVSSAYEVVNYRADGTPFWNDVRISPIRDETGAVTHYLGFQDDVTGRKRTEQLVRLLNRVLRHNLRNDMTSVMGYAELLAGREDGSDYADRILDTASSLVALSEQASTLKRVAGRDRNPVRLDPDELLDAVLSSIRETEGAATIDTTIATDRGVCAGPELEDALRELVANAIAHNPSADPSVAIEVTGDDAWVDISVTDDGPGIDELERAMIERGEETPLEHGSGLGLWLVNWIVTRYGGSFRIEARDDGDGSIATVRVPGIGDEETVEEAARQPTVLFR
ncbi:pas domain s-box [Salinarchaeum sp. Harcht-Bsk1]|uniref:PAS domain S-box protein n=1 Tax=Salinarchaeum sp. Harcht-Bsk1 TaxID=1333523 RepID=UPI0003422C5B|nr:PAS domain S-box protein [Salinarchaeum sp. Harcht-Bsk1]AGN02643.1 pas domain s-box [Salinarchaeum sp. Harcht-Bsk1]